MKKNLNVESSDFSKKHHTVYEVIISFDKKHRIVHHDILKKEIDKMVAIAMTRATRDALFDEKVMKGECKYDESLVYGGIVTHDYFKTEEEACKRIDEAYRCFCKA